MSVMKCIYSDVLGIDIEQIGQTFASYAADVFLVALAVRVLTQ